MVTEALRAMAMMTRWQVTKRAMTTRVVGKEEGNGEGGKGNGDDDNMGDSDGNVVSGNKEDDGEGGKSNSNDNEDCGQQRGQWQGRQG
jgi:hypothetical protein